MKKLFMTLIASMLLFTMGSFATQKSMTTLNKADAQVLFGQNTANTIDLNKEEMINTEGEWFGFGARLAYHGAHHVFRYVGRSRHLQLNVWRHGVSGSGRAYRIPWQWWRR